MSDWEAWPEKPPAECIRQLRTGDHPAFSVAAVWLHRAVAAQVATVGPFMTRALRTEQPGMPPDRAMAVMLQPIISVVFREWAAARPEMGNDGAAIVKAFAQMVADMVLLQMELPRRARRVARGRTRESRRGVWRALTAFLRRSGADQN